MQALRFFPFVVPLPRKKNKRHSFTVEEDAQLVEIVTQNPSLSWSEVARSLPARSARQCRERWSEYLHPDIRIEAWTEDEDELLLREIAIRRHRWTSIALAFANRSANDIKNRWYSHLSKCVRATAPWHYEFVRDVSGSRLQGGGKRKRNLIPANKTAHETVQQRRTENEILPTRTHAYLPQSCAPDCERPIVGEPAAAN
jgi:hypothetical protein